MHEYTPEASGAHEGASYYYTKIKVDLPRPNLSAREGEVPPVNRVLRFSLRPFILFAVIFGVVTLLALMSYLLRDRRPDLLSAVFAPPLCYVLLLLVLCSIRVTVSDLGINIRTWYVINKFIRFDDIHRSEVQTLAERDWPLMVTLYGRTATQPLARIGLKAIRQEDAAWLCSLPQLKVVAHRSKKKG